MKKGYLLLAVLVALFFECQAAQYATGFKKQKKQIESYTLFTPAVVVVAKDDAAQYIDTVTTKHTYELIKNTTIDLLLAKYNLTKAVLPKINFERLADILQELEESPESIDTIAIGPLLKQMRLSDKCQYAILITYNGEFNPRYDPHYDSYQGMSGIMMTNTTALVYSTLCVMIIDTKKEKIVYFDSVNSSKCDPRVPEEIEQITKNILKKIY